MGVEQMKNKGKKIIGSFLVFCVFCAALVLPGTDKAVAGRILSNRTGGDGVYFVLTDDSGEGGEEYIADDTGAEESIWPYLAILFEFPVIIGTVFLLLFEAGMTVLIFWELSRAFYLKDKSTEAALAVLNGQSVWKRYVFLLSLLAIFSWPALLLFIFWYYFYQKRKLVRQSRICPGCRKPGLFPDNYEDVAYYFSGKQELERELGSVEHSLYRCRECNEKFIYTHGRQKDYRICPGCQGVTQKRTEDWKVIQLSTFADEGKCEAEHECGYCGKKVILEDWLPRMRLRKGRLIGDEYDRNRDYISMLSEIQRKKMSF